jgi:hypothetical protein
MYLVSCKQQGCLTPQSYSPTPPTKQLASANNQAVLQEVSEEHERHEAFFLFSLCDPAKQVDDEENLTDDILLFG